MSKHNEHIIAKAMMEVLTEETDDVVEILQDRGLDGLGVDTYADCGVLTRDAGFVICLPDGAEYQVTVVRSR